MIYRHLKLKLTKVQEESVHRWIPSLTSIWNWAICKIENDSKGGIYYSQKEFQNILCGTSKVLNIPSHTVQGVLISAHMAWQMCYKKAAKKPRFKGNRNRLNSIPFPDPFRVPKDNRITVPGLGRVRYHKQDIPEGKIKCGRVVKRASGWYLCLFIDAEPAKISGTGEGAVGIDPGYKHLLTLSTGEKVAHPKELQHSIKRIGQAQRGGNKRLVARLNERIANQRKDRNHNLSHRLVAENAVIAFSKDNIKGLSRAGFGKSVAAAGHGQFRLMLAYKSRAGGRQYIEVPSKGSTRTCSTCGASTGPQGRAGLSVRQWTCSACGTPHDRDVNAAINTLNAALGMSVERAI